MKGPAFRAINPMGKVPALVHDGRVITECAAICLYLAEAFPEAGLMPADRAALYRWMFFGAGPLEQAVVNTSFGWVPQTPQDAGRTGYGSLAEVTAALTGHLAAHPYVCGEAFSCADVYIGSQVAWGLRFGTMPANDTLAAYHARLKDRPAARRANAADDALMPRKE
jgi:glutathione S-transferase